jgi:hypothetical protein
MPARERPQSASNHRPARISAHGWDSRIPDPRTRWLARAKGEGAQGHSPSGRDVVGREVDAYRRDMARGIGENPARSPAEHLRQLEYPATREDIVQTAADNDAPVEVINFFKSLPKDRYQTYEEVLRDFAEAERRFGLSNFHDGGPTREDIGKAAVESPDAPTRHP